MKSWGLLTMSGRGWFFFGYLMGMAGGFGLAVLIAVTL